MGNHWTQERIIHDGLTALEDCARIESNPWRFQRIAEFRIFEHEVLSKEPKTEAEWRQQANRICPGIAQTTSVRDMIDVLVKDQLVKN